MVMKGGYVNGFSVWNGVLLRLGKERGCIGLALAFGMKLGCWDTMRNCLE